MLPAANRPRGVDLISAGWLTHSAPVLDIGLDWRRLRRDRSREVRPAAAHAAAAEGKGPEAVTACCA